MTTFESPIYYSPPFWLKVFLGLLGLGFFGAIVYFLLKTEWLKKIFLTDFFEFFNFKPYEMRGISKKWKGILKRVQKAKFNKEAELKLAIIEADDLLNEVLKKMGYREETLSQNLKNLPSDTLSNLNELLEAHQIKNNIVHDPTYRLTFEQTYKILKVYEKALLELQVL